MEDTAAHEAIHVRGRIYSESPIYAKCKNAPAKKVYSEPCWRWQKKRRQSGQLLQTQPLLTRWKASFYQ